MFNFSLTDYLWARCAVDNRAFPLPPDFQFTLDMSKSAQSEKRELALVPGLDLANHRAPPEANALWLPDDVRRSFTLFALRNLQQGEEVFKSYGQRCNSRWLINYGFCLPHNGAHNKAAVWVSPHSSPTPQRLSSRTPTSPCKSIPCAHSLRLEVGMDYLAPAMREVFSVVLRLLGDKGADAKKPLIAESNSTTQLLTLAQEMKVLDALADASQHALAQFSESIAEDDKLLASGPLAASQRSCVLMRRGEKHVLLHHIRARNEVRSLFDRWSQLRSSSSFDVCSTLISSSSTPVWQEFLQEVNRLHPPTGSSPTAGAPATDDDDETTSRRFISAYVHRVIVHLLEREVKNSSALG
jgi:histone-lysine N-methyltransferase SETD3